MAVTTKQLNILQSEFDLFSAANMAYQQGLAKYRDAVSKDFAWERPAGEKWSNAKVDIAKYLDAEKAGVQITSPEPTEAQQEVIELYRANNKAAANLQKRTTEYNFENANVFTNNVHKFNGAQILRGQESVPATTKNMSVTYYDEGKEVKGTLHDLMQRERAVAARAEAAAVAAAPPAGTAPAPAAPTPAPTQAGTPPAATPPAPAPATPAAPVATDVAKAQGIENLKATIDLVGKGAIIKIDGTSPKHEPARVEVANALERYFGSLEGDNKAAAWKALGLKEDELITNRLSSEDSEKVFDRKLLGKALRLYQKNNGLVADGKVGSTTLGYLLSDNDVPSVAITRDPKGVVTQSSGGKNNEIGNLCGKRNGCDLRDYVDGTDPDPKKDAAKKEARKTLLDVEKLFEEMKVKVAGQDVAITEGKDAKVYTAKENATLTALFNANGAVPAPIDTSDKISSNQLKALQKAFGLKADGVISTETARLFEQIEIRLATDQVIDPSEIRAAVVANAKPVAKATPAK